MYTYRVVKSQKISPSTLLLTLNPDENSRSMGFLPGQYAAISFYKRNRWSPARCFSIVSSPTDLEALQFSARVKGRFTTALSKLQAGDVVNVQGPYGGFVFHSARDKKAVLLAGGIGITPMISMIRYATRLQTDNHITLLYSVANAEDIPFGDELLEMERRSHNFKVVFVVGGNPASKPSSHNYVSGMITPDLVSHTVGDEMHDSKFFVCGPPGFMKAMTSLLVKQGVRRRRILTEAFSQASPHQTGILRSWPANVYAMGALGLVLGSLVVMVSDLIRTTLPSPGTLKVTESNPFLITNARQKTLDQLVNSIPPSPSVIKSPTANPTPSQTSSQPSSSVQQTPVQVQSPVAPPQSATIYTPPKTTVSAPPP